MASEVSARPLTRPLSRPAAADGVFNCVRPLSECFESGWMDFVAQEADFINNNDVVSRQVAHLRGINDRTKGMDATQFSDGFLAELHESADGEPPRSWAQIHHLMQLEHERLSQEWSGVPCEQISPALLAIAYCYHELLRALLDHHDHSSGLVAAVDDTNPVISDIRTHRVMGLTLTWNGTPTPCDAIPSSAPTLSSSSSATHGMSAFIADDSPRGSNELKPPLDPRSQPLIDPDFNSIAAAPWSPILQWPPFLDVVANDTKQLRHEFVIEPNVERRVQTFRVLNGYAERVDPMKPTQTQLPTLHAHHHPELWDADSEDDEAGEACENDQDEPQPTRDVKKVIRFTGNVNYIDYGRTQSEHSLPFQVLYHPLIVAYRHQICRQRRSALGRTNEDHHHHDDKGVDAYINSWTTKRAAMKKSYDTGIRTSLGQLYYDAQQELYEWMSMLWQFGYFQWDDDISWLLDEQLQIWKIAMEHHYSEYLLMDNKTSGNESSVACSLAAGENTSIFVLTSIGITQYFIDEKDACESSMRDQLHLCGSEQQLDAYQKGQLLFEAYSRLMHSSIGDAIAAEYRSADNYTNNNNATATQTTTTNNTTTSGMIPVVLITIILGYVGMLPLPYPSQLCDQVAVDMPSCWAHYTLPSDGSQDHLDPEIPPKSIIMLNDEEFPLLPTKDNNQCIE